MFHGNFFGISILKDKKQKVCFQQGLILNLYLLLWPQIFVVYILPAKYYLASRGWPLKQYGGNKTGH